jgi:hypothetical protein
MADFRISDEGTVVVFTPLSQAAQDFLDCCQTESWQWLGPSLVVDHRPAHGLLTEIINQGMEVTK